jgi:Asp-tRNA(Asn)/Glu-tRNA(Gln) amidotransferase A subunit family amidase
VTRYPPLASVTGRPALSVPCGFSSDGLPIGFQIVGNPGDEQTLFRVARAYARATDWGARRPPAPTREAVGA